MKLVKSEKLEKSMYELQFSVDAETFKAAINKAFKKEGKKYAVAGFRKGKAPRHLIEKMYGEDIFHYDAINDLFPEAYEAAVKEAGIEVVGQPQVDVVSESLEEGVVLKAIVPVKPEVVLGDYVGLKATKKVNAVEDAEIDSELAAMQQRNARKSDFDGKAEIGDIANIDFEGFVDGVAFEGGKGEGFDLKLGSGQFIPGFEDQIVGHVAADEFDVNVTFPEEYGEKSLAGKPAVFKTKLNKVVREELPELDDDFASEVSEFDTLDELKADIRKKHEESNAESAEYAVENDLIEQVVAGMQAEIPDAMIEGRIDEDVQQFAYRLQQQGLNLEDYLKYTNGTIDDIRENYRENAEKQVKIGLALEAIVAKENIEASEEDYEAKIKEMAEQYQMEAEQIKAAVPAEGLKKELAMQKAIDFVKEKAEITTEA